MTLKHGLFYRLKRKSRLLNEVQRLLIFSFVIISFQLVERVQNGSGLQLFGHVTG